MSEENFQQNLRIDTPSSLHPIYTKYWALPYNPIYLLFDTSFHFTLSKDHDAAGGAAAAAAVSKISWNWCLAFLSCNKST